MKSNTETIIAKVRSHGPAKILTVPRNSRISLGDYVLVQKLQIMEGESASASAKIELAASQHYEPED